MPKPLVLTAVSLMLAGLTASAAVPVSLVQNEYAFAQAVADQGVRDGFLKYLDIQAITLTPQPVNAYDLYASRKPSSTKLSWYPSYALVSSSGDFGVDTGPWTADWTQDGTQHQAHGDWLTVWHLTKDGQWRIFFDAGVDHALPAKPVVALDKNAKVKRLPQAKAAKLDEVHASLQDAETLFSQTAIASSPHAAYAAQASADVRLLQEGSPVLLGKSTVLQSVSMQPSGVQWAFAGGSAARSGDLGYMCGTLYSATDDGRKKPLGGYMHVWRRDKGVWKLLIALELPEPPPAK